MIENKVISIFDHYFDVKTKKESIITDLLCDPFDIIQLFTILEDEFSINFSLFDTEKFQKITDIIIYIENKLRKGI